MPDLFCRNHYSFKQLVAISAIALIAAVIPKTILAESIEYEEGDRLWLINTRGITSEVCRANLDSPALSIRRLDCGGPSTRASLEEYSESIARSRSVVVYIHGNRMDHRDARQRGLSIYRSCRRCRDSSPVDWVIWSWPSSKTAMLVRDARIKAERTDAQGLYLAWLLREHAKRSASTTLIGYSFGGRIATGALHALAGGTLGGRRLSGPEISGQPINAGLIAPAIDSHWLGGRGYHGKATSNMHRMLLMYNHSDFILKSYWRIDKIRGRMALGYSGPTVFAPRADGSKLPVRSRDCSRWVGIKHHELDYYHSGCRAGSEMASLIDDVHLQH
jgi:hypothetical protein